MCAMHFERVLLMKLMFNRNYQSALPQKIIIILCLFATIFYSFWLQFFNSEVVQIKGDFFRIILLYVFSITYILRIIFTLFVFLKRKIPWWESLAGVFLSIILYYFIQIGSINSNPINVLDFFGILLYLLGSYLNTRSEYGRYKFKRIPNNKGHIFDKGLFKYARHINYFGDVLLFTGFALVSQNVISLIIPFFMGLNFVFILIPAKESYLKEKYGEEFEMYRKHSKKLIPLIY